MIEIYPIRSGWDADARIVCIGRLRHATRERESCGRRARDFYTEIGTDSTYAEIIPSLQERFGSQFDSRSQNIHGEE